MAASTASTPLPSGRPDSDATPSEPRDPVEDARSANLRYVTDSTDGFRRIRDGDGFRYEDCDGAPLEDPDALERIESLAIPPAWTDVWICPDDRGHLQATGRDAKGRKQYRYHPKWREVRDRAKFRSLVTFGRALPDIRARVDEDLALEGLPKRRVLALVVRILDETCMRVGNPAYRRENGTHGLTTLQDDHADIHRRSVTFHYKAKSGREREVALDDPKLARLVRQCRDIPGQDLFQYVDPDGQRHPVRSEDVNGYIQEIAGEGFSAKDFRTWTATVLAARELDAAEPAEGARARKSRTVEVLDHVAEILGNTRATTRNCYVDPRVRETYEEEGTLTLPDAREDGLSEEEARVLTFLEGREF